MIKEINVLSNELNKEAAAERKAPVLKLKKADLAQAQQFLIDLAGYWRIIRLALKLVKVFTGKKADAKIDEIIAWGDENIM